MLLDELTKKGLIRAPDFVVSNTAYLTIMGSHAYGVADTSVKSKIPDCDCYGFCIPKRDMLFPHLRGEVLGFGTPGPRFEQYQQHQIFDTDAHGGRGQEWDLQIFNIIKYFELCRQGNPNLIDSLFTPEECVIHCTKMGRMVRDNRKLFISKEIWSKFRGYAYSQLKKMDSKEIMSAENLKKMKKIEQQNNIDEKTTFKQVEQEIKKRKITITSEANFTSKAK